MIETFEDYTSELTEQETAILPDIVGALNAHVGKEKAVTNAKMREGIARVLGVRLTDAKMRKIIHHIQIANLCPRLVSCGSSGYYIADNRDDLVRYVKSLAARANSIRAVQTAVMIYNNVTKDELSQTKK